MEVKLFGFNIVRPQTSDRAQQQIPALAPPTEDDSVTSVTSVIGGAFGVTLDVDQAARDESQLILRYRDMALAAECDRAIQYIRSEAICSDDKNNTVRIVLDNVNIPPKIKTIVEQEFQNILTMMNFNSYGQEYFLRWYVDGRIYFQCMIDYSNTLAGIQELRIIDPLKIRRVREEYEVPVTDPALLSQGKKTQKNYAEYYMYNDMGFLQRKVDGVKVAKDTIAYSTSGLIDRSSKMVVSHLHKAVRPYNQLRYMEDAAIIYRVVRAPERRIFTIDVGELPKQEAERYVRQVMETNKSKLQYDSMTGEIKDSRKFMNITEDYYLPTRGGNRGIKIDTLPSGDNLGEMTDVEYFQQKLYEALNVPLSRLNPESMFSTGINTQITNEEMIFHKFINSLRNKFAQLFTNILEKQLILKNIFTEPEWHAIRNNINYRFHDDSHFDQQIQLQNLQIKLNTLSSVTPFIGTYFSKSYVMKSILDLTDEQIEQMQQEINFEIQNGDPTVMSNLTAQHAQIAQNQFAVEGPPPSKDNKQ
jgi:hypothetical protein